MHLLRTLSNSLGKNRPWLNRQVCFQRWINGKTSNNKIQHRKICGLSNTTLRTSSDGRTLLLGYFPWFRVLECYIIVSSFPSKSSILEFRNPVTRLGFQHPGFFLSVPDYTPKSHTDIVQFCPNQIKPIATSIPQTPMFSAPPTRGELY
jgi:hypothetical protein